MWTSLTIKLGYFPHKGITLLSGKRAYELIQTLAIFRFLKHIRKKTDVFCGER